MGLERNEPLQSCRIICMLSAESLPSPLFNRNVTEMVCLMQIPKLTLLCCAYKLQQTKPKSRYAVQRASLKGTFTLGVSLSNTVPVWKFRKERKHQHLSTVKEEKKSLTIILLLSKRLIIPSLHKLMYSWLLKHWQVNTGEKKR